MKMHLFSKKTDIHNQWWPYFVYEIKIPKKWQMPLTSEHLHCIFNIFTCIISNISTILNKV